MIYVQLLFIRVDVMALLGGLFNGTYGRVALYDRRGAVSGGRAE